MERLEPSKAHHVDHQSELTLTVSGLGLVRCPFLLVVLTRVECVRFSGIWSNNGSCAECRMNLERSVDPTSIKCSLLGYRDIRMDWINVVG